MNKYSNQVYISLGILAGTYIFLFLGIFLLIGNNGIYIENEKLFGTIFLIAGLLTYVTGLLFSIINSNNFLYKLDLEDDNSDLLFFQLKKNLLLKCLYGFIVISPFFISSYNQRLLKDDKYNASEELKNGIRYNNKLKLKIGLIFICVGLVISTGIIVLNSFPIEQFETKRYDDTTLMNEGKFEVKVYDDSFTIKSLSEIHSITVHKFDYKETLPLNSKVYEIKTLFNSIDELKAYVKLINYNYSIDGLEIEITEDLGRMLISYDTDIIIVLCYNRYKEYIIYSVDKLTLRDVGNNQFKSITSHTHYVRDVWFKFSYFILIVDIMTGFIVYFSKKKYNK